VLHFGHGVVIPSSRIVPHPRTQSTSRGRRIVRMRGSSREVDDDPQ
jgi:hypothetical protein